MGKIVLLPCTGWEKLEEKLYVPVSGFQEKRPLVACRRQPLPWCRRGIIYITGMQQQASKQADEA